MQKSHSEIELSKNKDEIKLALRGKAAWVFVVLFFALVFVVIVPPDRTEDLLTVLDAFSDQGFSRLDPVD